MEVTQNRQLRNAFSSIIANRSMSLFLLALVMGCAAVAPPPGGPVDKTPPSLIRVDPPSGTTGIAGDLTVTLAFSERLDEKASVKGVRIAPSLKRPFEIRIRKNRMQVRFPKMVEEDQTYLIMVTRDIVDERGNRLDRTYQLAFSTGSVISTGGIEGTIYSKEKGSSIVYLYRVGERSLDSLFTQPPDYYTETDDSGRYTFSYLQTGEFQVLAFQGGVPPSPIAPSRIPYGVHWTAPIHVTADETAEAVNMRISREIPPLRVVSVGMETSQRGVIAFTNPVHLSSQGEMVVQLVDPDKGGTVLPDHLFQYFDGDRKLRFHATEVRPGEVFTLVLSGVQDSVGQILAEFTSSITIPRADTVAPAMISPKPAASVQMDPGSFPLTIQFSGVVQYDDLSGVLTLKDTSGLSLPVTVKSADATRIQVLPRGGWQPQSEYTVTILGYRIRSPNGISMKDSTVTVQIRVGQQVGFGGLFGTVQGRFVYNTVVVAASAEKPSDFYSIDVNSHGNFGFHKLPAQFWLLTAYQDRDSNGRYSYGRALPFQPSEPFIIYPDTVEVRANWDLEGILLEYHHNP